MAIEQVRSYFFTFMAYGALVSAAKLAITHITPLVHLEQGLSVSLGRFDILVQQAELLLVFVTMGLFLEQLVAVRAVWAHPVKKELAQFFEGILCAKAELVPLLEVASRHVKCKQWILWLHKIL